MQGLELNDLRFQISQCPVDSCQILTDGKKLPVERSHESDNDQNRLDQRTDVNRQTFRSDFDHVIPHEIPERHHLPPRPTKER